MLAHHSAVSIAHQAFQALFRSRRRTAKAREEKIRLFNLPADVNHDQQIVTIRCQHLLEFALEVMDALVEFMDLLHGPGPFEVWTGLRDWPRRPAKGGHDRHFGRAHLKGEEEQ